MFTLDDILLENADSSNFLVESSIEENFFISSLQFVTEMENDLLQYKKDFYKSILESNNDQVVITESFSDFTDKVKELIKRFLNFIKSLFERFVTMLHKIIKSEKYLKKNEKKLREFNDEDEFDYKGYNYSFKEGVPVFDHALAEFKTEFVGLNPADLGTDKKHNKDVLNAAYRDLKSALDGMYYDGIRGKVIGRENDSIIKEDFHSELFETFRSGFSDKETILINGSEVIKQYGLFDGSEKAINTTKKDRDRIDREYKEIEKFVEKMVTKNPNDVSGILKLTLGIDDASKDFQVDSDVMSTIDLFVKAKCNQIVEMQSIHSIAFGAKLEAYKECYKQSKDVLYKALTKINKRGDVK